MKFVNFLVIVYNSEIDVNFLFYLWNFLYERSGRIVVTPSNNIRGHICAMFILGAPVEFSGQLTRSSLGELANIGDLYDATTDRFTGQSVVTGSATHLAVDATLMESYQDQFLIDDIVYDRFCSLANENELQLSVLLGLVGNISVSPTHCIFLRSVTTLHEQVGNITDIERLVSSYDEVGDRATHVVVGVVWGATVAVCVDRNNIDIASGQPVSGNSQQLQQQLMSVLKSGAQPSSQALSDINNSCVINCYSNCLPQDNQLRCTSLVNALALLSDLPQLSRSVNNGKGAPLSFVLMPLSSLTGCRPTESLPIRIEEPVLTQTLTLLRETTTEKHIILEMSQYLDDHKNYLNEQERGRMKEFLAGFQQAEKKLFNDVADAVVALRSGHLHQSRLADILRAFSCGCYSADSLQAFFDSLEPTIQKIEFFVELIYEGIVIIGNSQTDLRDITSGQMCTFCVQQKEPSINILDSGKNIEEHF